MQRTSIATTSIRTTGGGTARSAHGVGRFVSILLLVACLISPLHGAGIGPSLVGPTNAAKDQSAITDAFLQDQLSPLESDMFADAADGQFDEHSLMEAALIACGVRDKKLLKGYLEKFDALVEQLCRDERLKESATDHNQIDRAQIVFEFMHAHILNGRYNIACTDLRGALDDGRYNCVSATVLFGCLAERCGLTTCGLETTGHAMSRLIHGDESLDIETTYPRWFELLDDPEKRAKLVAKAIGRSPHDSDVKIRQVSGTGLVAMIYYNRGIDLLAAKHFSKAAKANAKALQLDEHSTTAKGNLLATLNNWAIDLGRSGEYDRAVKMLKQGMEIDPAYETFTLNYVHVHYQWVEKLCKAGRFEEALKILAAAAGEQPNQKYFRQATEDIHRRSKRTPHAQSGNNSSRNLGQTVSRGA